MPRLSLTLTKAYAMRPHVPYSIRLAIIPLTYAIAEAYDIAHPYAVKHSARRIPARVTDIRLAIRSKRATIATLLHAHRAVKASRAELHHQHVTGNPHGYLPYALASHATNLANLKQLRIIAREFGIY